jgi:hypothetical protein
MRTALGIFVLALAIGCRWEANRPVVAQPAQAAGPRVVFEDALSTARELGYRSFEVDEKRRFATFFAEYGNFEIQGLVAGGAMMGANTNFLMMKVLDDGRVKVWASGPDVRGDRIDRQLAFEADVFANRVAGYKVVIE